MELISRVMDIYSHIDHEVAAFQLKTGLRCPTGCGACCSSQTVAATVVEMLPAAHEILCRGEAGRHIALLEKEQDEDRICVFYQKDLPADAAGHCGMYALRPAVCRLFGFTAIRDRLSALKLAACRHLKQIDPKAVHRASKHQTQAPCYGHYGTALIALDIQNHHPLPINTALYQAIMRIGLNMQISHSQMLGSATAA